jgi:hypothetical protein
MKITSLILGVTLASHAIAFGQQVSVPDTSKSRVPCMDFKASLQPPAGAGLPRKVITQVVTKPERTMLHWRSEAMGCHISVEERFKSFLSNTLTPGTFAGHLLTAGYGQFRNTDPSFGQGVAGYARRYGIDFVDTVNSNFFKLFFYPSITGEDPYYHAMPDRSFGQRLLHSISHVVAADTTTGRRGPNFSEWLGQGSAAALSNLYHPDNPRGFGPTATATVKSVGFDAAGDVVKEFVMPFLCDKLHVSCD